ncbi:MAG: DUF3828 domain-containing protein [Alphaproteobacteria bacterium]|nr:DUF3828 domain-containing protein [Alphaproteobacteria bacterium]
MRTLPLAAVLAMLAGAAPTALATTPPAPPATPDPSAVSEPGGMIRDLYERYYAALTTLDTDSGASMPSEFEFGAIADRYFAPALAARFKRALESEEPVFDWDFFINGQDYQDLKIVSVDTQTDDGAKATVSIVTSNTGQQSTTGYDLVKEGGTWKIADITFSAGTPDAQRMTAYLTDSGF